MILFLDDSPERSVKMYERMTEKDRNRTIWCKSSIEAIYTLKDYCDNLETLFLDHDLGVEGQNFQSEESGMEVVRYLQKTPEVVSKLLNNDCNIIVHSWNIPAARIMLERLIKLGFRVVHIPFGM